MSSHSTGGRRKGPPRVAQAGTTEAQPVGELSPLSYMLRIVNDSDASAARRDRMAVAALRYCHSKPVPVGKKHQQAEAAARAGDADAWSGDLEWSQ
jgi:hypothetical protein